MTLHGRAEALSTLGRLMETEQLVTVTGPGGVGKSALVAEAVRGQRRRNRPDLIHLDLAPVSDPELVPRWLSYGLKQINGGGRRQTLLVVDTCEHVADAAGAALRDLIAERPALRAIATSRIPTAADGATLPLGPLDVDAAVELFRDCAPGYRDDGAAEGLADDDTIREICELLDGLPLAVTIAAAQLQRRSPDELLTRLAGADGALALVGGGPEVPERQRTLRDSMWWSRRVCTPGERLLWARAAVFPGAFTLAHATEVCADERLSGSELVRAFAGLRAQGLFAAAGDKDDELVWMPRAVRAYGRQQLARLGEETEFQRRCVAWSMDVLKTNSVE
ncbi:hypothetical protein G5C51_30830 [Streptomyces sp. A7024]|uniref:AAA+ ATPase domain-containing protein n=1 Tax=Streptomyces coryli TaxID=1128680 RepID=A0A6G4U979_9ACTN|nr:hypothetical protein [Streptomyces coryli]NGN68280.1 hypothetical protein [Streptomyces coryli]